MEKQTTFWLKQNHVRNKLLIFIRFILVRYLPNRVKLLNIG
ncbi:hypothetical protein VHARVF571_310037 [Vibrio harveyi]|nr:hypothetical protein VHARVF571_310037 [Vibrio harveyi]CAH1549389.1 hypothetical protein THOD03_120173 [Vibrio harveyi]